MAKYSSKHAHSPPANHPWRVDPDRFFTKKSKRLNMIKDIVRSMQKEKNDGPSRSD